MNRRLDPTVLEGVPRQRGATGTGRAGPKLCDLPALHRTSRIHGHRSDGPCHARRCPSPSRATVIGKTAIQAETERSRIDWSARCAETQRRGAGLQRAFGAIHINAIVSATAAINRGRKSLSSQKIIANVMPDCRLCLEFHVKVDL